jgi:hypothetical protein
LKLGLVVLAGQFPGMTEGEALAGAVDNAVAAEQAGLDSAGSLSICHLVGPS